MKLNRLFFGIILILWGVFSILYTFFNINLDLSWAKNAWPLILIFWGVSFLNIPNNAKKIATFMAAFTFALVALGFFISLRSCSSCDDIHWKTHKEFSSTESKNQKLQWDSTIKNVDFEINYAAGSINIGDETESLVEANSKNVGYDLEFNKTEDGNHSISLDGKGNFGEGKFRELYLGLNKNVIWNLDISSGAASIKCDLTKFKIDTLNISSGASSMYIKFGVIKDTINLNVNSGVSNLKIDIPKDFSVRIESDLTLTKSNLKDFTQRDEDIYISNNFGQTNKIVFITFEGALSNFDINRY